MLDIDSEKWLEAMKSEMDAMDTNQVWTLVDSPEGIKPIGCKLVFKRKTDVDGKTGSKGYKQRLGIDFEETFSPVTMLKSTRILLTIVAYHDYEIWQMDVKTAFLNRNLQEEVYMTQLEGFISNANANKVCKLQKSIYGLKQASRSWNICFDDAVKGFDFIKNEDEPCVYKKILLSKQFSIKDLGEVTYILGIKIYRDSSKRLLGLSQTTYIDKVPKRFSMMESKKGHLPMSQGIYLSKDMYPKNQEERDRMDKIPYASAIGSIIYQANPGESHWIVVKNIFKYLRRTRDIFLVYGGGELQVKGYTDASFQTDKDDSKFQSGYVFTLNEGAVNWKSSKQEMTVDSTTEAEYIFAFEAAKEAVWIKKFITELNVVPSIIDPIPLYCDNNGAIAQAKEPRSHKKSKHILQRYHDNIAYPLTKALSQQKHNRHVENIDKAHGTIYALQRNCIGIQLRDPNLCKYSLDLRHQVILCVECYALISSLLVPNEGCQNRMLLGIA
ncbi:Reverse transcriptase [Theobroma cacao]|nr:Reverse transcriptase [Theobroma cacao]